jgi:hypothetical protein
LTMTLIALKKILSPYIFMHIKNIQMKDRMRPVH